jgi:hypothetical protein
MDKGLGKICLLGTRDTQSTKRVIGLYGGVNGECGDTFPSVEQASYFVRHDPMSQTKSAPIQAYHRKPMVLFQSSGKLSHVVGSKANNKVIHQ